MGLTYVPTRRIRPWFSPDFRAQPSSDALKDAEALWLFHRGNLTKDETGRHPLTPGSTSTQGVGPGGRGARGDLTKTSALTSNGWFGLTEQVACWMLVVFSIPATLDLSSNRYVFAARESSSANSRLYALINTSGYIAVAQADMSTAISTGVLAEVGKTYAVLMRARASGSSGTVFVNGAQTNSVAGRSTSGGSQPDDFLSLLDLSNSATNFASNVVVHACLVALSDITDEKAKQITAAPFKYLFQPARRDIWVPVSAGGGITGTGSITTSIITTSSSGLLGHKGTGSLSLVIPNVNGTGSISHTGVGSILSSSSSLSGNGKLSHIGSGSINIPITGLSGIGELAHMGYGTLAISLATLTGVGTVSGGLAGVTGTGDLSITVPTLSASGLLHHFGIGTLSVSGIQLDSIGSLTHTGIGTIANPVVTINGSGTIGHTGTGSFVITSIIISGSGTAGAEYFTQAEIDEIISKLLRNGKFLGKLKFILEAI